jgi:hypothetical protein
MLRSLLVPWERLAILPQLVSTVCRLVDAAYTKDLLLYLFLLLTSFDDLITCYAGYSAGIGVPGHQKGVHYAPRKAFSLRKV